MKDTVLVVSIILMIGCCAMAISSNQTAGRVQQDLEQERYQRIVAEENLYQANMKLTSSEVELTAARTKIETIQNILKEGKDQSSDLKVQLDSLTRTRQDLEKKIEDLKVEQAQMVSEMEAVAAVNMAPPVVENIAEPTPVSNEEVLPEQTP